jgi:hypothetical protein
MNGATPALAICLHGNFTDMSRFIALLTVRVSCSKTPLGFLHVLINSDKCCGGTYYACAVGANGRIILDWISEKQSVKLDLSQ